VTQLLEISRRFSTWIAARWPLGSVRREWPVEHRLAASTLVRGTIDVVVETETTLAIIDHKVLLVSEARGLESAAAYAGQLRTYAAAILATGKRREVELLIHLPLSGVVAWIR
jgi:ATP-dependent exoDNAse (exonuclease V) beta subunit